MFIERNRTGKFSSPVFVIDKFSTDASLYFLEMGISSWISVPGWLPMIRYALYLPKMNGVPLQMSAYQMRFLMALADGVNEGLSSVEVLNRYRLVSSDNVVAVKRSLLDKNLIFTERKKVYLSDPVLGMWLKR